MAERPDAVEIEQRSEVPAFGPRSLVRGKCADGAIAKVGMPRSDPVVLITCRPKAPSARPFVRLVWNSHEKCGLSLQARDDRAFCEKPLSVVVWEGFECRVRYAKVTHLAFVHGTKLIAADP